MTHKTNYSTFLPASSRPLLALVLVVLFAGCDPSPPPQLLLPTTIIMVRHAEKEIWGADPGLTQEGQLRALELAFVLEDTQLDAIYSTDTTRTLQTAEPVAQEKELDIGIYLEDDPEAILTKVLDSHEGGTVLIVGHSTNIPGLANLLSGTDDILSSGSYDRLLIANAFRIGNANVTTLQYR